MIGRLRAERGQTSAEYLGVILLIAAVLAAISATAVGDAIANGLDRAVCQVFDSDCGPLGEGRKVPTKPERTLDPRDPNDLDRDGIGNLGERRLGTDPRMADSDRDGVLDGRERAAGTDPVLFDSDDDGLADGQEVDSGGRLDPTKEDSDADGLTDAEELAIDSDPSEQDGDGAYGSPGDGLTDAEELEHGTDPNAYDTDGDGRPDGLEVREGSDPTEDERNIVEKAFDAFLDDPFTLGRGTLIKGGAKKVANAIVKGGSKRARRLTDAKSIDEADAIREERLEAARKQLRENKRSGDAARDEVAGNYPGSHTEVSLRTSLGTRRIDVLTPDGRAIESKAGRSSLSKSARRQIEKDIELREYNRSVGSLEWRFSRSPKTGKCGPTMPLRRALDEAGIAVIEDC
jgi:Bacterial TSP3 repeat